jgi:hypothetical protein
MKKFIIAFLLVIFTAPVAMADWSVTVSNWTPSAGPNLAYEEVRLDNVVINNPSCQNIPPAGPHSCNFTVTDLTNQEISIVSFNNQGTASAPHIVGNLLSAPAPASGGVINITIVSP